MRAYAVAFICPFCGHDVTNEDDARYGWCRRCRDCTAMCGAGRRVVIADPGNPPGRRLYLLPGRTARPRVTGPPRWDVPCLTRAADIWELTCDGVNLAPEVLCALHGEQVRSGMTPGLAGLRRGPMPGVLRALASWNDWL
jgi:hypothetical protein